MALSMRIQMEIEGGKRMEITSGFFLLLYQPKKTPPRQVQDVKPHGRGKVVKHCRNLEKYKTPKFIWPQSAEPRTGGVKGQEVRMPYLEGRRKLLSF